MLAFISSGLATIVCLGLTVVAFGIWVRHAEAITRRTRIMQFVSVEGRCSWLKAFEDFREGIWGDALGLFISDIGWLHERGYVFVEYGRGGCQGAEFARVVILVTEPGLVFLGFSGGQEFERERCIAMAGRRVSV